MTLRRERTAFVPSQVAATASRQPSRHPSETGVGWSSIRARDEWKHRQERIKVGLTAEELPINEERDRLEVTLSYGSHPPGFTRKALQDSRRRQNFEQLQQQVRKSEENFVGMGAHLHAREEQDHLYRTVQGESLRHLSATRKVDNRNELLAKWQPKLDAKFDASDRMARGMAIPDRTPFWHMKDTFNPTPKYASRSEMLTMRRKENILDRFARCKKKCESSGGLLVFV